MSEVLEAKLVEYLQKTESFVISEAPEFVRQAVNYYFYEHLLTLIVCLFLILFTSLLLLNITKINNCLITKYHWGDSDAGAVCLIGGIISTLILIGSFVGVFVDILYLIKICVTPNLYLLERFIQ